MFLQRLELQGFKSFAGKTVIDFPEGIAAIVGPNGSGKSNITDAIRWLLGEREAKNLRGGKADDLIFAGTEKKARMGMAQASLYFDNSSGFFPTEYKEVVITRRIDREGDSRFMLNQNEMRLKDIIDFFARARLGARGLNIISQGESDAFLRATPLERREMIEEILGLKEYLLKKNSAVRELKTTGLNLDKAKTMHEEMKPHLKMLRRQVGRYEERDALALELSDLENLYYGMKAKGIVSDLARFEPELETLEKEMGAKRVELIELEGRLKEVESSEPAAKKELEEIRKKRRELVNERMNLRPETPRVIVRKEHPKGDPVFILRDIRGLAEKALLSSSAEELKDVLKKIISFVDQMETKEQPEEEVIEPAADPVFENKVVEFNKLLDDLDAVEKKLTSDLEGFNQSFRSALTSVEKKKDEISSLEDRKERLVFEREKIKYREEELENQLKVINRTFAEFASFDGSPADFDPFAAERRIFRLRNELASIGEVDESIVKESKDTEERSEFLTKHIDDLEKASIDLRNLIKELDQKIHKEFVSAIDGINKELSEFSKLMFGGGKVTLVIEKPVLLAPAENTEENLAPGVEGVIEEEEAPRQGIDIEVSLPKKRIKGLEVLSGGERSLLAVTILFGLISISPPPFIIFDEVDAALDERNARRFGELLAKFMGKSQFIVVTHNRATMESADALYGVTMGDDGASKLVSLKLS